MARSPAKKNKAAPAHKAPAQPAPPTSDLFLSARQLNVLVIDDDADDRMTVRRAIEKSRLNPAVTEADSIAAALAAIRKKTFDVVILDHILPDGKSRDFLYDLRSAGIRVPIVMTTGYGDEMLVADSLKSGVLDYIPKDKISAESVSRAIAHAVRVFKAEEDLTRRDALLEAGAEACILMHTQTDRLTVISGALGILGRAVGSDRVAAFEIHPHPETRAPAFSHRFEWVREADSFKFNDPAEKDRTFESLGLGRWHGVLTSGHTIGGPIAKFPEAEQKQFADRGVRSLLLVPVMVEGRCWGFVQVEDWKTERVWVASEQSILTTMAMAIGVTLLHRRADEALRRSEVRYRAIVDGEVDPMCRMRPDGTLTFVNDAFCRFHGKTRDELLSRNLFPFVPEAHKELARRRHEAFLQSKTAQATEASVPGDDGRPKWYLWTHRPILDDRGALVEIQLSAHDITDRKQAEETLRSSEEKFRSVLERIPAITYTAACDEPSTTLYISPQIETILGITPAEFLRNPDLWREHLHPDDAGRVFTELGRAHKSRTEFTSEYRMFARDGHVVWIRDTGIYVQDSKTGVMVLHGVMHDITDVKAADEARRAIEGKYQALIDSLNIGVFRTSADPAGRLLETNAAHARMLGFDSVEELMKMPARDLYQNPAECDGFLDEILEKGFVRDRNVVLRRKDGSPIHVSLTGRAHFAPDGTMDWIDGLIEDVSERRRLAANLIEVQEKERREISAVLHDELGQLLTLSRLELGSVQVANETSQRSVDNALLRLDEALRSVRRLAVSLRPPILDDLGLAAALEALVEEFSDRSDVRGEFRTEGKIPEIGRDENTCLYRVLQEALTNAAKHSGAMMVHVTLREDGGRLCLEISDSGRGFDEDEVSVQKGIGFVGMRERLARCGGQLEIRSEKGVGTTIRASVPLGDAKAQGGAT